ncbi:hypothetical protein E4U30_004297 [Claviceps sp. LM220 group G6]|nr:hypothetical protein E4U30_004297 [Claviceps sp. LM220 group G6]KAG6113909.1 hypothetical protein E4U14_001601 [Claviceps sp. LM454 group G7]
MNAAEPLPPPLKIPEVSRFINRANQLRAIRPAIAYWCEYHAVNQIVTKSLHTASDDCFAFTKSLIERLEATKTERAEDDAVVDNTAGQAYVEQFAQETFSRAERAMRANKVTRQTADTFDAAATFFDLTHEWGTPDPEILKKIKFAKWNAARILKALREGRDPNESNPNPTVEEQPEQPLSPSDPAVRAITQPGSLNASVEDVEDAGEQYQAGSDDAHRDYFQSTTADTSISSPLLRQNPGFESIPSAPLPHISPVPSSPEVQILTQASPQMPSPITSLPSPPALQSSVPSSRPQRWEDAADFSSISQSAMSQGAGSVVGSPFPTARAAVPGPPAAVAPTPNPKDIEQAQKYARWAISALNFEDVPTAVQELRRALSLLGG